MAVNENSSCTIFKGATLRVTVEEALSDVLLVCFVDGEKLFRGALLDSRKRNQPFGVSITESSLRPSGKSFDRDETDVLSPLQEATVKPEMSALRDRHTYTLDPNICDPKMLPSPRKDISSMLRHKGRRPMRLRPKQAYCVKCKKKLIDDKEFISHEEINFKSCKRKLCDDMQDPANQKRLKENSENTVLSKSSPVIKISYSSPKGGDTVMKILPRPESEENGLDLLPQFESASGLNHKQYRKLKRALKEARMKAKQAKLTSANPAQVNRKSKERGAYARKSVNTAINFHKSKVNWQPRVVLSKHLNRRKMKSPTLLQTMLESKSDLKPSGMVRDSSRVSRPVAKRSRSVEPLPGSSSSEVSSPLTLQVPKENGKPGTTGRQNVDQSDSFEPDSLLNECAGSLKMRIQTQHIDKVQLEDGRTFNTGSIAWGKIQGFPWWPCKVGSLTQSVKNSGDIISQTAHVSWFGASTFSQIQCSELRPFLADFKARHNKKKKGSYRSAVRCALLEAKQVLGTEESEADYQALEV